MTTDAGQHTSETTHPPVMPGIARLWDPRVWGTFVGAAGGSVFVLSNRGALDDPWPLVALVVWVLVFAGYLAVTLLVPRAFLRPAAVGRSAILVYLVSVAAMIAVIQLGRILLESMGRADVLPGVIVLAVGAHFFPFAGAFHDPFFTRLAWVMVVLGVLAVALGLAWTPTATAAVAVFTGLVMLTMLAGYAWAMRPRMRNR